MSQPYASSTGQAFTNAGHLDAHFEANHVEYRELLNSAGIEAGWRVLDAGCGGGNYLPWIAELVGDGGSITALDLAPENIEIVRQRLATWDIACAVEPIVGSVLDLPFSDDSFDAVWCANTTQYLTDDELGTMLTEFRRVVHPGGLVAIKEFDGSLMQLWPSHPAYLWRAADRSQSWDLFPGAWRGWSLHDFLEVAGLDDVRSRRSVIEHRAPLSEAARKAFTNFWSGAFAPRAVELAKHSGVGGEELQFWIDLRDDTTNSVMRHPDFYMCEGQVLALGRVPEAK